VPVAFAVAPAVKTYQIGLLDCLSLIDVVADIAQAPVDYVAEVA